MLYKYKFQNPNQEHRAERQQQEPPVKTKREANSEGETLLIFRRETFYFFLSNWALVHCKALSKKFLSHCSNLGLIMRSCALVVCLVLGISVQDGWSAPLKSVFVTFPGDIIKNLTDMELAEVSSRWFICLDWLKFPKQCAVKLCGEVITWIEIPIPIMMLMKRKTFNSQFKLNKGVTKTRGQNFICCPNKSLLFQIYWELTPTLPCWSDDIIIYLDSFLWFVMFSYRVIWISLATWTHCNAVASSLWCPPPKHWRGCRGRWGWRRLESWISPPWRLWDGLAVGFLM